MTVTPPPPLDLFVRCSQEGAMSCSLDHPPLPIFFENDPYGRHLRKAHTVWKHSSPERRVYIMNKIRTSTLRLLDPPAELARIPHDLGRDKTSRADAPGAVRWRRSGCGIADDPAQS